MAFTTCFGTVSSSISQNCSSPIVGGYTGRGVLVDLSLNPTWTVDQTDNHIISAIAFPVSMTGAKFIAIDNVWTDAFTGSTTALSGDNARPEFTKTFTFRIPRRGSDVSTEFVEPLVFSPLGYAAVLEKMDRIGNGSFEVIGYRKALKVNSDGVSRNEYENGGDITVTMSTNENWFEVVYFSTDYATTLTAFEAMYSTNAY